MASGMEMMMKSLGINPDEIKASLTSFKTLAENVQTTQAGIDFKLEAIQEYQDKAYTALDSKLDLIDSKLDTLIAMESGVDQSPAPDEFDTDEARNARMEFKVRVREMAAQDVPLLPISTEF
jgi:hypothetical protein